MTTIVTGFRNIVGAIATMVSGIPEMVCVAQNMPDGIPINVGGLHMMSGALPPIGTALQNMGAIVSIIVGIMSGPGFCLTHLLAFSYQLSAHRNHWATSDNAG